MTRYTDKKEVPPPTEQDLVRQQLDAAAQKGVITGLKRCMADNPHRLINALNKHDIQIIAYECLAAWIELRLQFVRQERLEALVGDTPVSFGI